MKIINLNDWMTLPGINLGTKITSTKEDEVYHTHDFYEIFYILEGHIEHICNDISTTLETGDMVFLRLTDKHMFKRQKDQPCKHRDIIINKPQFENTCAFINPTLLDNYNSHKEPLIYKLTFSQIEFFEKNLNKIINLSRQEIIQKAMLINIISVELINIYIQSQYKPANTFPAWLEHLLSRFNMSEFLKEGLPKILEESIYDKSYICRIFKKHMGITMSQHLCNIRLEYAANLIQFTDSTILQICNTVGFSSIAHFNSQFKQKFNTTPLSFRSKSRL